MQEKVNILVSEDYIDHFPEVVDAVQRAGLHVEVEMEEIGVVSGSVDHQDLAALRRVKGVYSIEAERAYHLPAPWSDTQ